jgi:PIN domain nuclease of toxin-antitoxin system
MVVLDTCAIIELACEETSIGNEVMDLIEDGAVILSISFAEIACKLKTGKLNLKVSSEEILTHYRLETEVSIIDISPELWHKSIALEWDHKDPADRVIVAYAKESNLKIVSSDKLIKKYYSKTIWKKNT